MSIHLSGKVTIAYNDRTLPINDTITDEAWDTRVQPRFPTYTCLGNAHIYAHPTAPWANRKGYKTADFKLSDITP